MNINENVKIDENLLIYEIFKLWKETTCYEYWKLMKNVYKKHLYINVLVLVQNFTTLMT